MVGLFGYVAAQNKKERGKIETNLQTQTKLIQIIDGKKSQNLAILLRALSVTTEQVCDAVKKGDLICSITKTLGTFCFPTAYLLTYECVIRYSASC